MTAQEHLDYWLRALYMAEQGGRRRVIRLARREARTWAQVVRDEHWRETYEAAERDAELRNAFTSAR